MTTVSAAQPLHSQNNILRGQPLASQRLVAGLQAYTKSLSPRFAPPFYAPMHAYPEGIPAAQQPFMSCPSPTAGVSPLPAPTHHRLNFCVPAPPVVADRLLLSCRPRLPAPLPRCREAAAQRVAAALCGQGRHPAPRTARVPAAPRCTARARTCPAWGDNPFQTLHRVQNAHPAATLLRLSAWRLLQYEPEVSAAQCLMSWASASPCTASVKQHACLLATNFPQLL